MNDEVATHIEATPERVYELISDVTRMGEWSPECYRCEWDGTDRARPGARFKAWNRKGMLRWSNRPEVIAAEPGREFTFRRTGPGAGEVVWRYRLTAQHGGTDVAESYEVRRPLSAPVRALTRVLGRVRNRTADLHDGMTTTLARLKAAAEERPDER